MSKELVDITTKNGMWKQLARYLVKQQDPELWASVLREGSINRDRLVEAVQQIALPESDVTEEISTTVKAFMDAELTEDLTAILDQIVVRGRFRKNRYLENLLIMSAVRAAKPKVMEYVSSLDGYDAMEIASLVTEAGLYEEAKVVYDKFDMKKEAATVLLRDLKDLPRGRQYAQQCNTPAVWTVLGEYLLAADEVREAIEVLIRARNPNFVDAVTAAAERTNQFGDLIKYLNMARQESLSSDNRIDSVLLLTYARTGRLSELEELLANTHSVQIQPVADKCFEDGLYESARMLYSMSMNFHKLALTLARMNNLEEAVGAAQKAQSRNTWDAINIACVEANELKLAAICAVPLVLQVESLQDVVNRYEKKGLYEELFAVLKTASTNSGAHMGIFTEMGLQLAKYKPEKLLEHVHMYSKKVNAHKLIAACEEHHHWLALRVLHIGNEDWLAAAKTMINHFADAFDHEVFKDVARHLGASDFVYSSINFYVNVYPQNLCDFLSSMFKVLDAERVLREVKSVAPVYLIQPYLEAAQTRNSRAINDALNNLYVEEENFVSLRNSVENYNNFDSVELSARLEKMELFEFRKIALFLHRRHKAYGHALAVAKENKLFQEAIDTAVESADAAVVEELLNFFVVEHPDSFVYCLYACYDYVSPDVVLEKAWLNNRIDIAMPYLIQVIHDYTQRVSRLEKNASDIQQSPKDSQRRGVPPHGGASDPLMIQSGSSQSAGMSMHNMNMPPQQQMNYGVVPPGAYGAGMNPGMMPH
uniref:Putative clathrin heavy chain n=1 Tax=Trypanosoma congolense (strain IL3000) TaxID=1068625 RepID=G0UWI0_TRYCI|nr:putative clathrin heavy chain [Trypanosoma congolense IL3000]